MSHELSFLCCGTFVEFETWADLNRELKLSGSISQLKKAIGILQARKLAAYETASQRKKRTGDDLISMYHVWAPALVEQETILAYIRTHQSGITVPDNEARNTRLNQATGVKNAHVYIGPLIDRGLVQVEMAAGQIVVTFNPEA